MSVKIKRNDWQKLMCVDENTGNPCVNNGRVCRCNVYAGDLVFKNNFQPKE